VRVRIRAIPDKYEQTETIVGSFAKNHAGTLQISFEGHARDMHLEFRKSGAETSPLSEPQAPE